MAFSQDLKQRLIVALAEPAAATELEVAVLAGDNPQAANVADSAYVSVDDIALSTSNTYTDAAVNSAVNAAILQVNDALTEVQGVLNDTLAALIAAELMAA